MSPYTPSGYGFTPTPIGAGGGNGGGGLGGPGSGGGGGGGNNGSAMGGGYDISGATDYAVDSTSGQFDPQRPIEPLPDSNLVSSVVSTGKYATFQLTRISCQQQQQSTNLLFQARKTNFLSKFFSFIKLIEESLLFFYWFLALCQHDPIRFWTKTDRNMLSLSVIGLF